MVVAIGTVVVATAATAAWYAYEAGDCGQPGAMFACLFASLGATAAAVVLGPLLLWAAYRRAGVVRSLVSVVVAAVVAVPLLAAGALAEQVLLLAGHDVTVLDDPAPLLVGGWLGVSVLAGGLALQGPRRRLRAGAAALGLLALVVAAAALAGPADRARDGLDLDRATVPLLLPEGWLAHGLHVTEDGSGLYYDAVPPDWRGSGWAGVPVEVADDPDAFGDGCSYRPCTDQGDVLVAAPDGPLGSTWWRQVEGAVVTVRSWEPGPDDPSADPVEVLRRMSPVTAEELLDRRYP